MNKGSTVLDEWRQLEALYEHQSLPVQLRADRITPPTDAERKQLEAVSRERTDWRPFEIEFVRR